MRRLLLLLLAAACARPPPRDRVLPDVEVRLQRIELSRAPSAEVRALLASPEAPIRARAALAAGRIGDSGAVPDLTALLADPETAEPAAWALGRIEGGSESLVHCLDARCPGRRALRSSGARGGVLVGGPGAEQGSEVSGRGPCAARSRVDPRGCAGR